MSRKIDYLTVTLSDEHRQAVIDLVAEYLGQGEPADRPFGFYRESYQWQHEGLAAVVAWTEGRAECLVSLTGTGCQLVGVEQFPKLVSRLGDLRAKATRIDLTVDDHTRRLIPIDLIEAAAQAGDFIGFRLVDVRAPRKRLGGEMITVGKSITFGRKGRMGGLCQVQVYDKTLESEGKIDAIRLEARFSKGKANAAFETLYYATDNLERFWRIVGERAVGAIDFRRREGSAHSHKDRMPRYDWWQKLIDSMGSIITQFSRPEAALYASAQWLKRCALKPFGKIIEVIEQQGMDGAAFMCAMLQGAREQVKRGGKWEPNADDIDCDFIGIFAGG